MREKFARVAVCVVALLGFLEFYRFPTYMNTCWICTFFYVFARLIQPSAKQKTCSPHAKERNAQLYDYLGKDMEACTSIHIISVCLGTMLDPHYGILPEIALFTFIMNIISVIIALFFKAIEPKNH